MTRSVQISAARPNAMSRPEFAARLKKVLAEGNLTIADLARWFNRPHPTVAGWVKGGRVGRELAPLDAAYVTAQLVQLERRLAKKDGLPVPVGVSARKRKQYFDGLRRNATG
jgi:hypothetical protein